MQMAQLMPAVQSMQAVQRPLRIRVVRRSFRCRVHLSGWTSRQVARPLQSQSVACRHNPRPARSKARWRCAVLLNSLHVQACFLRAGTPSDRTGTCQFGSFVEVDPTRDAGASPYAATRSRRIAPCIASCWSDCSCVFLRLRARLDRLRHAQPQIPVPVRATDFRVPDGPGDMTSTADFDPAKVGRNHTGTLHTLPGASVPGQ